MSRSGDNMLTEKKAIIIDNNIDFREMYGLILMRQGFDIKLSDNEQEAFDYVKLQSPHIAIVHFNEDLERSTKLISQLHLQDSTTSIIYLTAFTTASSINKALNSGALSVLRKDTHQFSMSELTDTVKDAYEASVLLKQNSEHNPEVFVLMPFDKAFDQIYQLAIKEPIEDKLGFTCQRADKLQFAGDVMDEVCRRIRAAQLIVADLTGMNPNVFYEVGYAHALGKTVILLTQQRDNIPFDIRAQRLITYEGSIIKLRDELIESIKAIKKK